MKAGNPWLFCLSAILLSNTLNAGSLSPVSLSASLRGFPAMHKAMPVPFIPGTVEEEINNYLSALSLNTLSLPEEKIPEPVVLTPEEIIAEHYSSGWSVIEAYLKEINELDGQPESVTGRFSDETPTSNTGLKASVDFEPFAPAPEQPDIPDTFCSSFPEFIHQYGNNLSSGDEGEANQENEQENEQEEEETVGEPESPAPGLKLELEPLLAALKEKIKAIDQERQEQLKQVQGDFCQKFAEIVAQHLKESGAGVFQETKKGVETLVEKQMAQNKPVPAENQLPDKFIKKKFLPLFVQMVNELSANLVALLKVPGLEFAAASFRFNYALDRGYSDGRTSMCSLILMIAYHQRRPFGDVQQITPGIFEHVSRELLHNPYRGQDESSPKAIEFKTEVLNQKMTEQTREQLRPWMPYIDTPEEQMPEEMRPDTLVFPESGFVSTLPTGVYTFKRYYISLLVEEKEDEQQGNHYFIYISGQGLYIHTRSADAAELCLRLFIRIWWNEEYNGHINFLPNNDFHEKILGKVREPVEDDDDIPVPDDNFMIEPDD